MSIWAVSWALRVRGLSRTDKLALVALADYADDQDEAWPHVDTLASVLDASRRTVFRALETLESRGLVSRGQGFVETSSGGRRQVNSVYRLHVPDTISRRAGRGAVRPVEVRDRANESPCGVRGVMGVTPPAARDEMPSHSRGDTGDTPGLWGDTGDTSGVTPMSPLYEPSYEPPDLTPLPPAAGGEAVPTGMVGPGWVGGELATEVDGLTAATLGPPPALESLSEEPPPDSPVPALVRDVERVRADWGLCRRVLPESMQALDDPGVARLAGLLRERLEAGWSAEALRTHLAANPLPDHVRHLAALVAHRLGQLPVAGAPAIPRVSSYASTRHERPSPAVIPEWVSRRAAAKRRGEPVPPLEWWIEEFGSPSKT